MVRNSVKAPNYAAAVSENQGRGLLIDRDHQTASLNCNLTFQPDPDRHKNARCQQQLLLLHSDSVTCWTCVRVCMRGMLAVRRSCRPTNSPHKIRTVKPHVAVFLLQLNLQGKQHTCTNSVHVWVWYMSHSTHMFVISSRTHTHAHTRAHLDLQSHNACRVKQRTRKGGNASLESIYYTEAEHYHNIKECFCELINNESEGRAFASESSKWLKPW